MSQSAVLVVDMLNDFIRPDGALYCGPQSEAIVQPITERLEQARERGEGIIYTCDRHRPDDPEFKMFPPHCVAGTVGAEVIAELTPKERDRVIPKRRYSAFFGTDLSLIELVGVCTNICVFFTAADARNLAYPVTVNAGRVASFDENAHKFALQQMESVLGVTVVR